MFLQRAKGHRAELDRRVRLEQVRAAVHGVDWLARRGISRKPLRNSRIGAIEGIYQRRERRFRD